MFTRLRVFVQQTAIIIFIAIFQQIKTPSKKAFILYQTLHATTAGKCPNSELFWSAFSRIRTEYRKILRITPYSFRMRENADQNNSGCRHFLYSAQFNKIFYQHLQESLATQKQPSLGALVKRSSESMQQIYRRKLMPKCDFNKVPKQLIEIKLRHWYSPVNNFTEHVFIF